MRPTTGPMRKDGVKPKHAIFRNSSQPPKGMHINHGMNKNISFMILIIFSLRRPGWACNGSSGPGRGPAPGPGPRNSQSQAPGAEQQADALQPPHAAGARQRLWALPGAGVSQQNQCKVDKWGAFTRGSRWLFDNSIAKKWLLRLVINCRCA